METRHLFIWLNFYLICDLLKLVSPAKTQSGPVHFTDPTAEFGGKSYHLGSLAAVVDVNGDRGPDLIFISDDQMQLEILSSESKQVKFSTSLNHYQTIVLGRIGAVSVVPGDFNNDKLMDLLVTFPNESDSSLMDIEVFFGKKGGVWSMDTRYKSNLPLVDQPLLVDANADGISDLFVVLSNGTRQFWLGREQSINEEWSFKVHKFVISPDSKGESIGDLYNPQSSAYVPLFGSASSKLIVTVKNSDGRLAFETWKPTPKGLDKRKTIAITTDYKEWKAGRATYCDFNGDGEMDVVVPMCKLNKDNKCEKSHVIVCLNGVEWITVFQSDDDWNFVNDPELNGGKQPMTLVIGDFNHDGYIDASTTMTEAEGGGRGVVLLGGPCGEKEFCARAKCKLHIGVVVGTSTSNTVLITLADVNDDGSLDLLTTDIEVTDSGGTEMKTRAYINKLNIDHCFLNVLVLAQSKLEEVGFYHPLTGATVICHITDLKGNSQVSIGTQLTQTAYNSLQPPYIDFGLGILPNFVDSLELRLPGPLLPSSSVSLAGYKGEKTYTVYNKMWSMLIPNSLVLILPVPYDEPASWTIRIMVTPSRYFMMTLIVFIAVCVVVSLGIMALHCLEMRSDKRERILQKHNFHFDAM